MYCLPRTLSFIPLGHHKGGLYTRKLSSLTPSQYIPSSLPPCSFLPPSVPTSIPPSSQVSKTFFINLAQLPTLLSLLTFTAKHIIAHFTLLCYHTICYTSHITQKNLHITHITWHITHHTPYITHYTCYLFGNIKVRGVHCTLLSSHCTL